MADIDPNLVVQQFAEGHPRFIPSSTNNALLLEFIEDFDLPFDAHHLDLAYLNLAAQDKLELEPEEEPAPAPAPRRKVFQAFRNGRPVRGEVRSL
jgi:hypothetical protein